MLGRGKRFNRKIINAKTGSGNAKNFVYEIFVKNENNKDSLSAYRTAKFLGDVDSVNKNRVGKRVANRLAGKATGRSLFRWINKK